MWFMLHLAGQLFPHFIIFSYFCLDKLGNNVRGMIKEMKNKCTQKENIYLAHCVQNCLLGNKAWEDVAGFVLSVTN